ncbi:MAG: hypothetical protein ABIK83_13015 [Candidatus Zixiibacteriota bacterium]
MTELRPSIILAVLLTGAILVGSSGDLSAQTAMAGEQIAFIRNGDIWLMNPDGADQRPLVGGIQNAKGKLSWEPGNKRIVFSRSGSLQLKYPDGGGGNHRVYDLFFAFIDSTNNFWMGITETLGAQSPEWSKDGSKVTFTYDVNGAMANSTWPEYRVGFYDVKTRVISDISLPRSSDALFAMTPTLSPDGSRVAFNLARFDGKQVIPIGIVVTSATKVTQTAEELMAAAKKLSGSTSPSWSPDGNWIAYVSSDLSNAGLYLIHADGTGKKLIYEPSAGTTLAGSPPTWSPDSKRLAFGTLNGAIFTINSDGSNAKTISGPGSDTFPAWSR